MTQIFLNYRTDDEPFGVQLLDRELSERFGDDVVFFASRSIELGDDWHKRMFEAVGKSAALLVVIGRNWLDAKDEHGARRLDDPADFVRREIRAGLKLNKKVIPVRLDVPRLKAEQLPESLRGLAGRQDIEIRRRKARMDIDDLAKKLRGQIPALSEKPPAAEPPAPVKDAGHITANTVITGNVRMRDFHAGPSFH